LRHEICDHLRKTCHEHAVRVYPMMSLVILMAERNERSQAQARASTALILRLINRFCDVFGASGSASEWVMNE
jgi:hypothetical protein